MRGLLRLLVGLLALALATLTTAALITAGVPQWAAVLAGSLVAVLDLLIAAAAHRWGRRRRTRSAPRPDPHSTGSTGST